MNPLAWIIGGIGVALFGGLIAACIREEEDVKKKQDKLNRQKREWENARRLREEELKQLQLQQSIEARKSCISLELSNLRKDLNNFETEKTTLEKMIEELSTQIGKCFKAKKENKKQLKQIENPKILIQDKVSKDFDFPDIEVYFKHYEDLLGKIKDFGQHCQTLLKQREGFEKRLDNVKGTISDINDKIRQKEIEQKNLTLGIFSGSNLISTQVPAVAPAASVSAPAAPPLPPLPLVGLASTPAAAPAYTEAEAVKKALEEIARLQLNKS